jgi:hypothetical protein
MPRIGVTSIRLLHGARVTHSRPMKALGDVARAALGGQEDPSITQARQTAQPFASRPTEGNRPVI